MKIENEFTVSLPIDRAWAVLTDLAEIAPCLPGAQLTGVEDGIYSGKLKIKVGPVISDYAGTARFAEKDDSAYRAVIDAKGKDSRGAGNAAAAIHAQLRADGDRTVVTVDTDLNISGKVAQFGSGMIKEVSAKLLGQFVHNLEERLLASDSVDAALAATPMSASSAPAIANGAVPSAAAEPAPGAVTTLPTPRPVATAEPEPLDLMSLAGGSVYKRLIPVALGAAAIVAVIIYRLVR